MPLTLHRPQSPAYQLFMLFLCVATLAAWPFRSSSIRPREVRGVLQMADTVACGLFFIDFLVTLRRAPDKWRYMYTWGWLDLRLQHSRLRPRAMGTRRRLARLLRLLRGIKASMVLTEVVLMRRRQSAFLAAGLTLLLVLVSASRPDPHRRGLAAVQHPHHRGRPLVGDHDAHHRGYGDRYPVTTEGRIIAAGVMAAGVGLVGVLSGLLASWFMEPVRTAEQREEDLLELRTLRRR